MEAREETIHNRENVPTDPLLHNPTLDIARLLRYSIRMRFSWRNILRYIGRIVRSSLLLSAGALQFLHVQSHHRITVISSSNRFPFLLVDAVPFPCSSSALNQNSRAT